MVDTIGLLKRWLEKVANMAEAGVAFFLFLAEAASGGNYYFPRNLTGINLKEMEGTVGATCTVVGLL